MTSKELSLEMLKIKGQRFTLERALELSIKKWTELDQHWPLTGTDHFPISTNCPLCRFFAISMDCRDCPLHEEEHELETLGCCVNYADAVWAIHNATLPRFESAQRSIIEKLRAALRKTKLRDFEQECNDQEPQKGTGV